MTHQQAMELVRRLRLHRRAQISALHEENTELIKIIADYDIRLAEVEAQRDELKSQLELCQETARRISGTNLMRHRQKMTVGGLL